MRTKGLEPSRPKGQWILSPLRLPITPCPQNNYIYYLILSEKVKNSIDFDLTRTNSCEHTVYTWFMHF